MYKRFLEMLDFVYELQASTDGITLKYLQNRYRVSRRTAERMMKAIRESQLDVEVMAKRPLRVRLHRSVPTPMLSEEHVSALQAATNMFEESGMQNYANQLKNLSWMLRANTNRVVRQQMEIDSGSQIQTEGFAVTPGPREMISSEVTSMLRQAILSGEEVYFTYVGRTNPEPRVVQVQPYGFLHGLRQYLIAYNPQSEAYRTYVLSRISNLHIDERRYFKRDPGFSFDKYLADSFGLFRERPYHIVWHFDASVADDVLEWKFHPTQKMRVLEDGKVEVKFRAGGIDEMAFHLVTWQGAVTVVRPKRLIKKLQQIKDTLP